SFHRGDILLVLFPDSNLRTAKRRPVVVVQTDNLATVLDSEIDRVIGAVGDMTPVDQALRTTLGL
ncbi:MAG: hypothetical protein AAB225_15535, partial [Acidobacteriota bacterium]